MTEIGFTRRMLERQGTDLENRFYGKQKLVLTIKKAAVGISDIKKRKEDTKNLTLTGYTED